LSKTAPLLPISQDFQQGQDWSWPTQEVFKQLLSDALIEQFQPKALAFYFPETVVIKHSITGDSGASGLKRDSSITLGIQNNLLLQQPSSTARNYRESR